MNLRMKPVQGKAELKGRKRLSPGDVTGVLDSQACSLCGFFSSVISCVSCLIQFGLGFLSFTMNRNAKFSKHRWIAL